MSTAQNLFVLCNKNSYREFLLHKNLGQKHCYCYSEHRCKCACTFVSM